MALQLTPKQRLTAFYSLAGAAVVILVAGILAILVAVDRPALWLGTCLVLLLVIIIAEVALLVLEKQDAQRAPPPDAEFEL